MTHVVIHTLDWNDDSWVGEKNPVDPTISVFCIVTIDGHEIQGALSATPSFGSDFSKVNVEIAGHIEVVHHTKESWDKLIPDTGYRANSVRSGGDSLIATG